MHATRPATSLRPASTLIEVLVVVVIIAVLASLVAPNVFRHVDTAKNVTAQAQISTLGAALHAYRLDTERYPTTEQGLAALWLAPATEPRPSNWRGRICGSSTAGSVGRTIRLSQSGRPHAHGLRPVVDGRGRQTGRHGRSGRHHELEAGTRVAGVLDATTST